jgi:biotin synthase
MAAAPLDIDHRKWDRLAEKALANEALTADEALSILDASDADVPALVSAAFRVRHAHFGKGVQLYYLRNAKSGLCPEDCGYCSQSKISDAPIDKYVFQNEERLLDGARQAKEAKARTYCIVASGRGPTDREVEHVASVVRKIKDTYGLHICVCLGLLRPEQAELLKDAGVDRVNHNLNTSRRYYPEICTTHTFEDRLQTLKAVRNAGMELCSGCIIGMGEEHHDLVDVARTLRELEVESIPVNFLHPIEGTPLKNEHNLNPRDCLRALCLFRLTNPQRELRIAGGRELHLRTLQPLGLYVANSVFVSDYLTTRGQTAAEDYRMIEDMGFEVTNRAEFEAQRQSASEEPACEPCGETC